MLRFSNLHPEVPPSDLRNELEGFWDDDEHVELRVVVSIDDGGLRALLPFTDSFTIAATGQITDHAPA